MVRIPPETMREWFRAKAWELRHRLFTLRRGCDLTMRPFVVAGAPRSGTSLFCTLLSEKPNVIAVNEPKQIAGRRLLIADPVVTVRGFLTYTANQAFHRGSIINKVDPESPNQMTTDTWNRGSEYRRIAVDIDTSLAVSVGVKAPVPLFDQLGIFGEAWPGLRSLVLFRDPLRTINSWRQSFGWQPGLDDPKKGPAFKIYEKVGKQGSALERRARLWKVMAEEALALKQSYSDAILLIRYEEVLADPQGVIARAARHIGAPDPDYEIDVSFVRPQSRPNYKHLDDEEVAMITDICGGAWRKMVEATGGVSD